MDQPGVEQVNPPVDHEISETPIAVALRSEVKDRVKDASTNGTIREMVVDSLTEVEVNRRAKLLESALDKRDQLYKELNGIKPDQVQCDANGAVANEFWTKGQAKKRQQATEKLNKLDKAIDKAVTDADYDNLKKVLDKLSGGGDKKED